jgi:flagellar protein FliO/FliZ
MTDLDLLLRFGVALAVVLALIAGITWVGRTYLGQGRIGAIGGRRRRIAVVEAAPIDAKSRLVLVRRDEAEHLLVLGPSGATVVETGIRNPANFAAALDQAAAPTDKALS